jgi:hypothetical protein
VLAPDARPAGAEPDPGGGYDVRIAARPVEYETATGKWVYHAVQAVMRASDPVYAQLRPEPVETVPRQLIDLGDGRKMPVEPYRTSVHGSIGIDALIAGDLGELHAEICSIARQQLEQTMRAFFALIDEVTQQTGNVVDAHGDAAEGLLEMLEKMDIAFDDDGNPHLQMIASPETAERIRAQLEAFTPDQMQRLVAIINSKREQHCASRRRRRLPRYGN